MLTAKQTPTPKAAISTPASDGPTTREALKRLAFSATAFGSSSRPTSWKVSACRPGASKTSAHAAERREHVDEPERRRAGEDDDGQDRREQHRDELGSDHELAVVDAVGDDAGEEAEDRERDEAAEREDPDRDRRGRQLDHEPGERDVLHPRPDHRDELAGEEEAVVAVALQARERARVQLEQSRVTGASRAGRGRPRSPRAPRGSSPFSRSASHEVRRARTRLSTAAPSSVSVEPDPAAVALVAGALDQARLLEAVDVSGERGRGDPLLGGELAQAQARVGCGSARAGSPGGS